MSGFLAGYKSKDGVPIGSYYLRRARKILPVYYGYIAVTIMACFLSGLYGDFVHAPVRVEFMAVLGALLILNQASARPLLSLENKVFNWLGSISYEIYVVQILVIMLLSMLYVHAGWHWPSLDIFLFCTIVVIGVAKLVNMMTSIQI